MIRRVRIEVAGRLVREQHARRIRHRARDRDALLLAARELGGAMGDAIAEAEIAENLLGTLDGLGLLQAADHLRHHDVLQRREFRQQPVRLVDEADIGPAQLGALDVGQLRGRGAVDIDLAGIRRLEQPRNVQQRRLAGARRRHQRDRLARPQRELGAVEDRQRHLALQILPLYLVEINDRYVFRPVALHQAPHSYRSASTGSRRAARHDG